MTISDFQRHILSWYKKHKRDLPWRKTRDPYKILVSEIMLQQTQVSRVIPKYHEFLEAFPTLEKLATSREAKLLHVWSGLGYWRRARFLKDAAKAIVTNHGGKFPRTPEALQTLPGVGSYTAGAVACFAFNNTEPFIDTNIRRVFLYFFFPRRRSVSDQEILSFARSAVWKQDPRTWHYALFDYGAIELTKGAINKRSKHYTKQSKFEGSFRSFRTRTVKYLLSAPRHKTSRNSLLDFLEEELRKEERDYNPEDVIRALVQDKLVKEKGEFISL